MVISSNIKELKEKIGEVTYHKALDFPSNKLNIISFKDNPIKIRAIALDNDREYHIVISEKRKEIFHDCPSLMQAEPQKKICVHIAKLMLSIREDVAIKILSNYLNYSLTSDDIGSKRKSKNFLKLADFCLENNNYVDGLNYLNKSIINQCDCEGIIERYLQTALKNDSFIEFFEFLKHGYENDLNEYFLKFNAYIEEGFKRFIGTISKYSFFNLL